MPSKPVTIGQHHFSKKGDATQFLKDILNSYRPGQTVSEVDSLVLDSLLEMHPDSISKIGAGVDYYSVNSADFGTQCFWVHRQDGTAEKFSYRMCLN